MGFFSKDIKTMDDLFVHTLRDIYYAENQIVQGTAGNDRKVERSRSSSRASSPICRDQESREAAGAGVSICRARSPKGVDCPAIDGIIDEAKEVAGEVEDKNVLDAALIAAAQAVEHYEITRYGSLIAWAKQLGRQDCAALLQQNLDEEKAADKKLTTMAENNVNRKAA